MIKGMNVYKTLKERQQGTQFLIDRYLSILIDEGYNPITKQSTAPAETNYILHPDTAFVDALRVAEKNIVAAKSTNRDLRSMLRAVAIASDQLRFSDLPVSMTTRKYIFALLSQIETNAEERSPHRYNKNRSYLMMLFEKLIEMQTLEANLVHGLPNKRP